MLKLTKTNRFNALGFTIVEVLIAMGIVSVSSVGLLWSVNAIRDNTTRMQLVTSVTALEAALVDSMMNKANYTGVRAQMRAGDVPALSMLIRPIGFNSASTMTLGSPLILTRDLRTCSNFGTGDCAIRVRAEMRRIANGDRAHFAYAYRIETQDRQVAFNYVGAGAELDPSGVFSDDEFKVVVPYDYYLEDALVGCAQGEDMALTGVDVSTGRPICIKQPKQADVCPDGKLPKRLKFIEEPNGERRIALECGADIKSAECPQNYFLQSIDTKSLDGANEGPKVGKCVYAGRSVASISVPTPSKRIAGRVCPPGYRSRSRCYIDPATITSRPGSCPWCWGAALNCGSSTVSENPAGSGNFTRSTNYFCSDPTPRRVEANPGRVNFSENSPEAGFVDCSLQQAQQDCGAQWDAMVRLDVTCELYAGGPIPETVDVR